MHMALALTDYTFGLEKEAVRYLRLPLFGLKLGGAYLWPK